jgi:hypothetical protein
MTGRQVSRFSPPQGRRARSVVLAALVCLLAWSSGAAVARDASREQMKGLDEQVQEIKTDVLSIAAELDGLEERLLYPSNTQVAVFVALEEGDEFRLDSVQIQLNGDLVAHHIYSFKELEALQKGGVQRIFTGNVATGEHELEVAVNGKLGNGKDFSNAETFRFSKDVEPKLVGITLREPGLTGTGIELGNW